MKNFQFIILIFFILACCALCSELQAQTKVFKAEKVQEYPATKDIQVQDGMIYKWTLPDNDTARFFNPGVDQYEATITFKKKGVVIPPVFVTEKVDGEKATFTGVWTRGLNAPPGWYGENNTRTIAYSNSPGASVSYTFTGTKIEIFAEKLLTHGTGTVSIDNGTAQPVTFIGPSALPVLIYSSTDLPLGGHTIKLTVGSGYCLLDFFQIHKPQ